MGGSHSRSFQQPRPPLWGEEYYGQDLQGGGYAVLCPSDQPPAAAPVRQPTGAADQYSRIDDDYTSVEQVIDALARAGLESSNLIVGIDFTKSNEWTGKFSFHGRSLHHMGSTPNPYEQAISIIGRTLSKFDEDNMIPCFGFGDASTLDQDVFSFYPDERPCNGFSEALDRYRELAPHVRLAGPTSFAPIIEMAATIVEQSRWQHHVLLLLIDGQVTRSVDTASGQLSSQQQRTLDAIIKARELPLSIVLVGVGDGPWDMMEEFDDYIPAGALDKLQFVKFSEIMSNNMQQSMKEAAFALSALMGIPQQYKAAVESGILGRHSFKSFNRVPLPPPTEYLKMKPEDIPLDSPTGIRCFYSNNFNLLILNKLSTPHGCWTKLDRGQGWGHRGSLPERFDSWERTYFYKANESSEHNRNWLMTVRASIDDNNCVKPLYWCYVFEDTDNYNPRPKCAPLPSFMDIFTKEQKAIWDVDPLQVESRAEVLEAIASNPNYFSLLEHQDYNPCGLPPSSGIASDTNRYLRADVWKHKFTRIKARGPDGKEYTWPICNHCGMVYKGSTTTKTLGMHKCGCSCKLASSN